MSKNLYNAAVAVVKKLKDHGYEAFFAGGWVRDKLLNKDCEDIDIATNADVQALQSIFKKTISVGAQFGCVIVIQEGFSFEVSQFRSDGQYLDGRHPSFVVPSNPIEDAKRRDFTINGIFYNPLNDQILDYVEGEKDLKEGVIRAIGNPLERFSEDKLRMIRAVRFSSRFGYEIENQTFKAIEKLSNTLYPCVSVERIWQEWEKMKGHWPSSLRLLEKLGLLKVICKPFLQGHQMDVKAACSLLDRDLSPEIAFSLLWPFWNPQGIYQDKAHLIHASMANFFKRSKKEMVHLELLAKIAKLLSHESLEKNKVEWVKIHANTQSLGLVSLCTLHPYYKGEHLYSQHVDFIEKNALHIQNIQNKTSIIKASDLQKIGVTAGPKMGKLLEISQKLSIDQDIYEKDILIEKLKQLSIWNT